MAEESDEAKKSEIKYEWSLKAADAVKALGNDLFKKGERCSKRVKCQGSCLHVPTCIHATPGVNHYVTAKCRPTSSWRLWPDVRCRCYFACCPCTVLACCAMARCLSCCEVLHHTQLPKLTCLLQERCTFNH